MEGIQVSTHVAGRNNQISIIKVGGYIDTTTSSEVERALNNLLKQGRFKIIIDLGNVDYISSAGWGIFISEIKAIRENNGDLKLVRMIPDVYEIFELLEFHHILDVYDTVEEAIAKFEEEEYVEMVPEQGGASEEKPRFTRHSTFSSGSAGAKTSPAAGAGAGMDAPVGTPSGETVGQEPPAGKKPTVLDLVNMPIEEKVKYIVATEPALGAFKIKKRLNSPEFGYTKVGWLAVRSLLNRLGLNSRHSRRKFSEMYQGRYK